MILPAATLSAALLAALPVAQPGNQSGNQPGIQPGTPSGTPSPGSSDAARLMPESSLAYLEAPGLSELFRAGLGHPLIARLLESPLAELALSQSPVTPEAAIAIADQFIGEPVLPLLASLSAHGAAISVGLKRGQPAVSLVVRGDDEERWISTVEMALDRFATMRGLSGDIANPTQTVRGLDVWLLGDELAFALDGATLLLSNDEGRLRDMIDLARDGDTLQSLAERNEFRAAAGARSGARTRETFVWGWADLAAIEAAKEGALRDLRGAVSEPAPHFLLGSTLTFLAGARQVSARLALTGRDIELELLGLGIEPEVGAELVPRLDAAAARLPRPGVGDVARGAFYRDLAGLFRARGELFGARYQPKFAEATSTLALFFGGQDVSDSVLPGLSPWIGFVSRAAQFDANAVPDVPLPAAALLVRVTDESLGPQLVGAFQTFVGVINVDAAQSMKPSLTLGLELAGEQMITLARFRPPVADEGVDIRYNFVPACSLVGDVFVLGTHASLVRELVAQVAAGELEDALVEHLAISGAALRHEIQANREALVMNAVVNEGKSLEEARSDVQGLEAIATLVDSLHVRTDHVAEGVHAARLTIALTAAETQGEKTEGPAEKGDR